VSITIEGFAVKDTISLALDSCAHAYARNAAKVQVTDWLTLCRWTNNGMSLVFKIRAGADCAERQVSVHCCLELDSTHWRKRRHPVPSLLNHLLPPARAPRYLFLLQILILRPPFLLVFLHRRPAALVHLLPLAARLTPRAAPSYIPALLLRHSTRGLSALYPLSASLSSL
jgi:hypothetical protein